MRVFLFVVGFLIIILLGGTYMLATMSAGAGSALVGHWTGGLIDNGKATFSGDLMLYSNHHKFVINLNNKWQGIEVDGAWSLQAKQLFLTIDTVKLTNSAKESIPNASLVFIEGDDIRNAYGKKLILNLSPDGQSLHGLPIGAGKFKGEHQFTKAPVSSYIRK
ncbi:MAG: hypothetical protein JSS72_02420 [Armatimonadetes bacterium]|nr:hypothetical protein [Armatimonadota bacterium]